VGLFVVVCALEFAEYGLHRLPHHVRQYVQASPVRHADDEAVSTELGRPVDRVLQRRHDRLASVESESLRGVELVREEILERVREAQSFEYVLLLLGVDLEKIRILDALAYPIALVDRADVHVLDADGLAVRLAETVDDLPKRDLPRHVRQILEEALVPAGVHPLEVQVAIQVLRRIKAVEAHRQRVGVSVLVLGHAARDVVLRSDVPRAEGEGFVRVHFQWIEIRGAVAVDLVRADEVGHAE
jgi:hypothetical protein